MRMKNRLTDKEMQLEQYKEDCKELVCSQAEHVAESNNLNYGANEFDLGAAKDDLENLLDICDAIEKCKTEQAIKKVMLKYYTKKELKGL